MKVKPKKGHPINSDIQAVTDAVLKAPQGRFASVLANFEWRFDKGDFHHWIALFNFFDDYLEKNVTPRSDLQLDWSEGKAEEPPFPKEEVDAILNTTTVILENCSNKHLYQSTEHLSALLAAPIEEVVSGTLVTLVALVKRSHSSTTRFSSDTELNKRLAAMAQGWGGKEQGLGLLTCTSGDEGDIQQGIPKATHLHFSFYKSNAKAAQEDQIGLDSAGELCTIDLPAVHKVPQTPHLLLKQLVQQANVPTYLRFKLLCQIRTAKLFGTKADRRKLVLRRLKAFIAYMQSAPSQDEVAAYFVTESEFVTELVNLIEADLQVPEMLRTLALRALAVQLLDRHRHTPVITALSAGGQSGLLATLMRGTIAALTDPGHDPDLSVSPSFAEALFSLISALVASTAGCTALASAGLIPAFLPMLGDTNPDHINLVTSAVRIMETYMDFVTTASTLFRDLGGLTQMIGRLDREIQAASEPLQPGVLPPLSAVNPAAGTVPFQRRNLIKFLLRAIALASYSPGSGARPQEQDQSELFKCLRHVMENSGQFGGTLFSLAASVMTDLIHHDPLVFPALDQAGLPQAFIDSIKAGIIPAGDAIACVPTALVAVCLNLNGARKVKDSHALDSLVPVLTTPAYIKALSGETLGALGTGLDELMRHVPTLRESVIEVFTKILKALITLGGGHPIAPAPEGLPQAEAPSAEAAEDATQPMETDASTASEAGPLAAAASGSTAPPPPGEAAGDSSQQLGEMVQRTARVLEALLGNGETGRLFVQRNGINHLIPLYNLQKLAPVFGSHSPLHAVTSALRILAQAHARHISRPLGILLKVRLDKMVHLAEQFKDASVPLLPETERDRYTRELQMTEGVLGLAASLSRMSVDLLAEISRGDTSITLIVSRLERIVVKQTTVAQEWKMQRDAVRTAEAAKLQGEAGEAAESRQQPGAAPEGGRSPSAGIQEDAGMQEAGSVEDAAPVNVEPAVEGGSGKHKKRTNQECAYDALIQFASTARSFYVQIAKAIHNPSRRREEVPPTPCMPMQAAAAVVSITMRDGLTAASQLWPELQGLSAEDACRSKPVEMTQLANYTTHMAGGLGNTLFDARRRTCHSLILNYFVAGDGLKVLLQHFGFTIDLLRATVRMQPPSTPADAKEEEKTMPHKQLKSAVEGSVRMFLQLLDHLVNAEQLLNSPQAATLLLTPVPGSKAAPKQASADEMIKRIQATVSAAVMPLWADPDLAATSAEVAQRIVSILTKCTNGTSRVSAQPLSRTGLRTAFQPDPSVVLQISEMGFSQPRAEEALRRVQHNSVELAMEWLINHPEEAAPVAAPESDTDLVQSFTGIIDRAEASTSGESSTAAATPEPVQLVGGAVNMLAKSPSAAFSLADLLSALCRQNNKENARAVLEHLVETLHGTVASPEAKPTYAGRSASLMLAPAHLLALLTSGDPSLLATVCELGGITTALDLLEALLRDHLGFRPPDQLEPQFLHNTRIPKMPKWVDALLLMLDQAIKVQPTADRPAAQQQQAAGRSSDSPAEETMAEAPEQASGGPNSEQRGDAEVARDEGGDPAIASIHKTIRGMYSPGGLLTEEEQLRAAQICICLLSYLHTWAPTMAYAAVDPAKYSDPSSHAQAVLQLLARLTKKHSIAQMCLQGHVHKLLLNLPARATCPELTAHMCAIMRHLLEDPATLQAAMEAEIRSTLAPHNRAAAAERGGGGGGGMPLRMFLTNMATVIGRDPTVFFEALLATCCVSKETGRAVIKLKHSKAVGKGKAGEEGERAPDAAPGQTAGPRSEEAATPASGQRPALKRRISTDSRTPKHKDDSGKEAKSAVKSSRKALPASFVEVIDTLINTIFAHQDSPFSAPESSPAQDSKAPEDPPQQQPTAAGSQASPTATAPALMSPVGAGRTAEPAEEANAPGPTEQQPLLYSKKEHSVLIQCIALKMLTDFTLMYNSTVGVILRRDAELVMGKGASPRKTPRKEAHKHTGVLLRHIMAAHLASDPEPGAALQSLAQQASYFLLAVSIRSAEGRRRIVSCIVEGLSGGAPEHHAGLKVAAKPPLYKVKALVELITSLMCITNSGNNPRSAQASADHFHEMMRAMVNAGVRKALLQVLRGLDVNHPKAPQLINIILKPFEVLTRSFLWRGGRGHEAPGVQQGQTAQPQRHEGPSTAAAEPQQPEGPARSREGAGPEGEPRHTAEESAAGPEALAAAHHAMQEYDRQNEESDVDPQHARDLEEMVEAIMEQAYADDMLDEYGSEEPSDEEMDDEAGMEGGEISADERDEMEDSGDSDEEGHHDDDDDDDDDMSDDYSSDPSSPSEGGHGMDEHDAVILDDPDEEDEEAFLEGEEDEVDEDEQLMLNGPDFNAIDNAFQQGLDGEPPENDEDENAQFDDNEGWEEEEDEDEEDADDIAEADDNGFWEAPEEELDWEMTAPNVVRGAFGGLAGLQHPTQAMIEELFGSLGRVGAGLGLDRRRYQVITHQLQPSSQQRPRRPTQHSLLQRPPAAATGTTTQSTHRELHPMATALMNQLGLRRQQVSQLGVFSDRHGGGYLVFPDGRGPSGASQDPRTAAANPQQALPGEQQRASPLFSDAIDMLLGSSGSGGRQESRMANWSDDGLPPATAPAPASSIVAGTLEQQLADVLMEVQQPQQQQESAEPSQPVSAPPAGEAARPDAQQPAGETPADPQQPADSTPATQGDAVTPEQPAASTPEQAPSSQADVAAPEAPRSLAERAPAQLHEATAPQREEPVDQEMADVSPVREETVAETPVPRAADIEMDSSLPVDTAFLEALPPDLREEMLAAQAVSREAETAAATQSESAAAGGAAEPQAAEAAAEPQHPVPEGGEGQQAQASREDDEDDMEGIDPEFIAALPPDLQAEVLEQQRRERRLRQAAARRAEAQQRAAPRVGAEASAAILAAPAPAGASDMDMATILATFPPEVREEVLLTSDDTLLASLTPALLAEAQNLRERVLRAHREVAGVAGAGGAELGGLGRSLFQATGREARAMPANAVPFRPPWGAAAPLAGGRRLEGQSTMAELAETERYLNEEGPAPIDDEDVEVLVGLMRLPQPLAKQVLQRIFTNLCGHLKTRQTMLRLLVSLLHGPMARDSAGADGAADEESLEPVSCKRFMDMLVHLARYKPRVAQDLPSLPVPTSSAQQDAKGKSIAQQQGAEKPAVEILFGLLSSTLCERSNSHLISALTLLELVMSAALCKQKQPQPQRGLLIGQRLPIVPELPVENPQGQDPGSQAGGSRAEEQAGAAVEGGSGGAAGEDTVMEAADVAQGQAEGSSAVQQADAASSNRTQEREDAGAAARLAISSLPREHLEQVIHLLGWQRLMDAACTRLAAVALLIVECAPQHRDLMLTALDKELQRCGAEAAAELQRLADSSFGSKASQAGAPVLRLLQTLTAICKPDATQGLSAKQKAALDSCASRLEGLWGILSQCIARIEDSLGQQTPQQEQAHLLPPEAAQVLPFVEAFFVLCDARTAHLPQPEPGMLRAASSELARSTDLTRAASASTPRWPSSGTSSHLAPHQRGVLGAHLPFLRFAEKHRKLLNALLRQHPNLLEGSLSPLLRVARLVDFDNKRAYFRTKVRSHGPEHRRTTLRINVRREHVFEDSFHQLRIRTPEEMRAKLSVHFQGEEGIDAGGVSREWYQVMAREMFNPNFSLFVPVPEGGNTFQPNPNSIVQNDEARGTNHLDFFKFVGRVVGKALYDGMFVDAYFTRSLYKHLLDQPLTYMDIEAVDPEYFKNLAWMLENDITDVLDLTFTEEVDYFGRKEIKELKPGGKDIKVTEANKREYVDLIAQHHMTTAIRGQLDAFLGGFWDLIPKNLVKIFNDHELELLISGLPEIDVDDLRANTEYQNYTAASPTIQWFWEVVRGLEKQDLALLVQFVTGTSKVPLEGFKALQGISGPQKFQIHKGYGGQDRLPSAHTCFNQLDMIEYESIDTLRARLLTAIREGTEGFGFG